MKKLNLFFCILFVCADITTVRLYADWAMFGKNPAHTCLSSEKGNFPPFNPPALQFDWDSLKNMTGEMFASSPVIADIDKNDTCEIILTASRSGYVYVLKDSITRSPGTLYDTLRHHAQVLWSYKIGSSGWVVSSPLLFDVDNDGYLEIVFGSHDKSVYALNWLAKQSIWSFATTGKIGYSSPNAGDIDGNAGTIEVVIGSEDSCLYVINGMDGSLKWKYKTGGAIVSSPAIGDINGDGYDEIIIGSKDHKLYALNYNISDTLWTFTAGGEVWSSPALGCLDGDTLPDIVFGCHDSYVYAIKGGDSTSLLWSYKTAGAIEYQSAGLADIDKDSKLEVIIGSFWGSALYALQGEDGSFIWNATFGQPFASLPAIADIDNDGDLEIMTSVHDGFCHTWNPDGSEQWEWGYPGGDQDGPITVGDIDGDSNLEIIGSDIVKSKIFVLGFPLLDTVPHAIEETPKIKNPSTTLRASQNPFVKSTTIHYSLPEYATAKLTICDISGRTVKTLVNENKQAGNYSVNFSAKDLAPGIYFAKLSTPTLTKDICKKLILVK
ncbi:MAG: FG-GAP-like repeat-containing protein [bacterium]|nr:FG-GAP-like repeat-containing protein [bacterium]